MSSQIGDTDGVVKSINETRQLHVPGATEVMGRDPAPDVNESGYKFIAVGETKIRFWAGRCAQCLLRAIDSVIGAGKEETDYSSRSSTCVSASISASATSACSKL